MLEEKTIKEAKILIVDDQPANVTLIEKMLDIDGYINVISTTDPTQVESIYLEQNSDLVLLDLNMPIMDGYQVLAKIREVDPDYPPIIVLTAQSDRESRIKALDLGARDFLAKPFDRVELMTRIRNMLEVRIMTKAMKNQNIMLDGMVKERTKELNDTRLEVIRRLGRAAEYRDDMTGFHIIRMSRYSQLLALAVGMSEFEAEMLLNASPMHDIGKIGIPDHVLLKPGKLDAEEWTIMKTHVDIGVEILSGSDSELMDMASEVAQNHHEKWDGSGYPQAIAGEDIPLTGRVVAVADVFDALTTERPYKEAWPVEKAIEFLKEQSGKHFDPKLVEQFLGIMPDILNIRTEYSEG
ncbi:MAG: two-component system response regulator [Candidatus Aenigmarchaeota archaeon]|nr:two-component system response regulator [Candidatus Aenigmarchaeota archaeon]